MLNVEPTKVRVDLVDVGGAFGARMAPFSEYPLLLYTAKRLGRPIKWLSTRSEDFLTDNHGRASITVPIADNPLPHAALRIAIARFAA